MHMLVDTKDIRSATQVGRNFGASIDEVENGATIVVVRNNKPVAVLAPIELLEKMDEISEREEDMRLLALAELRMETHSGRFYTLEESAAELGIDLDALGNEDEE
jgi:prevent-host-death family protein